MRDLLFASLLLLSVSACDRLDKAPDLEVGVQYDPSIIPVTIRINNHGKVSLKGTAGKLPTPIGTFSLFASASFPDRKTLTIVTGQKKYIYDLQGKPFQVYLPRDLAGRSTIDYDGQGNIVVVIPGLEATDSISSEISQRIGLIANDCLSIEGPPLPRGTRVFAVTLDPPHQVLWSEVLGQRTSGCEPGLSASYRAYSISTDGWGMTYVDTAVGLVGFSAPPTLSDGSLSVRFSDDPGPVTFRNCSSAEGFHITAWRHGERIWHVYTWVPYDTPNTCTPEEVA